VFNPLSTPEVIQAVGGTLKAAAAGEATGDDYRRGQLLSAYSICRNLAAEEAEREALRRWFVAELRPLAAERGVEVPDAAGPADLGAICGDLLAELRVADDSGSATLATRLRSLLRELCDREIAALAEAE
jgi:hypothetical protein